VSLVLYIVCFFNRHFQHFSVIVQVESTTIVLMVCVKQHVIVTV